MTTLRPEFQTHQFSKGLEVRRSVLGATYVDKSVQSVDPFMIPLQKLVTEYCWGEIWTRPGLARRDRSMINLAMLAALNRPHELRLHVLGALNNGVTKDEVQEILLQVAIYCGVPAALDSFKVAKEVIEQQEAAQSQVQADGGEPK